MSCDQPPKEEYQGDDHEVALDRPTKRVRMSVSKQGPPKKRIKGKQGGLQGIMKMPIEIFVEIAPYVNPGDLISLIRTSKFFRRMLLGRSAAPIWQCALSNVPGLPPCPTGMVEPQYAALVFSKNCTICGAQAVTSKPDPYLRVRLCPSCRDKELVERSSTFFIISGTCIPYTLLIKKRKKSKSIYKNPAHQLRTQTDEFESARMTAILNGGKTALAALERQWGAAWETQRKEGDELLKYINSAAASRSGELGGLKRERRDQIYGRLKALGWDEQYFNFRPASESSRKQWHNWVDAPKPLTERTWTNMRPKLTQLLEENRPRVEEYETKQRLEKRRYRANELLRAFKRETNPYLPIAHTLRVAALSTGLLNFAVHPDLEAPFPRNEIIGRWEFLINLFREENTPERVDELFNERRHLIDQKLQEWRTKIEEQLVRQYMPSLAEGTGSSLNTRLTVKGSTEATEDLSDRVRFLLRADTVFMNSDEAAPYTEVDQEHGPTVTSIHFPHIPPIQNYPHLYEVSSEIGSEMEARELEFYVRHAGKEAIVKALLRVLNMPDAAHAELDLMGRVFICGRCNRSEARTWYEIVEHYHARGRDWVGGKSVRSIFTANHPIVHRNIHDLEPGASSQPLVRIGADVFVPFSPAAQCLICRWNELPESYIFDSLDRVRQHMLEIHDTADPVEKLHFITQSQLCDVGIILKAKLSDRVYWEEKWDKYYDTRPVVDKE